MSTHQRIETDYGYFFIGSFVCSQSDVVVPVETILKNSADTIGNIVKMLAQSALDLNEEEIEYEKRIEIQEKQHKQKNARPGFVYILKSKDGFFKIGKTSSPASRIKFLNIQLPHPAEVVHVISTDDMSIMEKWLHNRFASKRSNGEWFRLCDEDVEFIKSIG